MQIRPRATNMVEIDVDPGSDMIQLHFEGQDYVTTISFDDHEELTINVSQAGTEGEWMHKPADAERGHYGGQNLVLRPYQEYLDSLPKSTAKVKEIQFPRVRPGLYRIYGIRVSDGVGINFGTIEINPTGDCWEIWGKGLLRGDKPIVTNLSTLANAKAYITRRLEDVGVAF